MMRNRIATLVESSLKAAVTLQELNSTIFPAVIIGTPANADHGDFSCNIAMQMARGERKAPRQVAEILLKHLGNGNGVLSRTEIAGPGFINFFVAPSAWQASLLEIELEGDSFGRSTTGGMEKIQV